MKSVIIMYKIFFLTVLLGHVLGDFYFQTNSISAKKETSLKWVLIHSLLYFFAVALICFLFSFEYGKNFLIIASVVSAGHMAVDIIKYFFLKRLKAPSVRAKIFFADQFLHIIIIASCVYYFAVDWQFDVPPITGFFKLANISPLDFLFWPLALLLIHKPANIAISSILAVFRPENHSRENDKNAGRLIGTLERIIMLIFLSLGQYSALGLVLTAKSIARYDKITKDPDFAEYYLLGTLMSVIVTFPVSLLV